jgi:hypothetical protein
VRECRRLRRGAGADLRALEREHTIRAEVCGWYATEQPITPAPLIASTLHPVPQPLVQAAQKLKSTS